jgi:7-cyano-7-deazaguanine reductase
MATQPSKTLETFPNPKPERDYQIRFETTEFTCLCPKTGQPDFATLRVEYVPDALCVELKSWKLYLWSYRNEGAFHEAVTNRILDDLVAAVRPRRARVEGDFNIRGGDSYDRHRGVRRQEVAASALVLDDGQGHPGLGQQIPGPRDPDRLLVAVDLLEQLVLAVLA